MRITLLPGDGIGVEMLDRGVARRDAVAVLSDGEGE